MTPKSNEAIDRDIEIMKSFQACRGVVRSRRARCAGGGTWYHRMAILSKVSKTRGEVWVGGARLEHELTGQVSPRTRSHI